MSTNGATTYLNYSVLPLCAPISGEYFLFGILADETNWLQRKNTILFNGQATETQLQLTDRQQKLIMSEINGISK